MVRKRPPKVFVLDVFQRLMRELYRYEGVQHALQIRIATVGPDYTMKFQIERSRIDLRPRLLAFHADHNLAKPLLAG